jgi:hypothetical protein
MQIKQTASAASFLAKCCPPPHSCKLARIPDFRYQTRVAYREKLMHNVILNLISYIRLNRVAKESVGHVPAREHG